MTDKIQASDCKCCLCEKQAEVFWPCIDPDIQSHPYCKECVNKQQEKVMIELAKQAQDLDMGY